MTPHTQKMAGTPGPLEFRCLAMQAIMEDSDEDLPVIDSHIHLYAASHIKDLAWAKHLPSDHVLNRQNSVEQYRLAIQRMPNFLGSVFIETDRESGLGDSQWSPPLEEIEFLSRITSGSPRDREGHISEDNKLILGIIPWAPIPAGKEAVERYISKAKEAASTEDVWRRVSGFRYLVQDKPRGTLLSTDFIEGLRAMEEAGLRTFDLGVDARSGGLWQLEEACEMLAAYYETSQSPLNIILNHLCKPDLSITVGNIEKGSPDFSSWADCIHGLASFPTTFIKLSGLFSEMTPQEEDQPASIDDLLARTWPFIATIFSSFGPNRIMFGSDWPVCNVNGPGKNKSWQHWYNVVRAILKDQKLNKTQRQQVWSGTAARAYDLKVPTA